MDPDELAPNETFKAHLTKICLTGRARCEGTCLGLRIDASVLDPMLDVLS